MPNWQKSSDKWLNSLFMGMKCQHVGTKIMVQTSKVVNWPRALTTFPFTSTKDKNGVCNYVVFFVLFVFLLLHLIHRNHFNKKLSLHSGINLFFLIISAILLVFSPPCFCLQIIKMHLCSICKQGFPFQRFPLENCKMDWRERVTYLCIWWKHVALFMVRLQELPGSCFLERVFV